MIVGYASDVEFHGDCYVFIDIDEPSWAHEILLRTCLWGEPKYILVEDGTSIIGYQYASPFAAQVAGHALQDEENRRNSQYLLSGGSHEISSAA